MCHIKLFMLVVLLKCLLCSAFNIGMFKKNDYLMAQDFIFKERRPYGVMFAKYGRIFKCPITYIQVTDRLGVGNGPKVEILRGGLRHKFVVLRLTSLFNHPIAANVYIGCENKTKSRTGAPTSTDGSTSPATGTSGTDGTDGTTVPDRTDSSDGPVTEVTGETQVTNEEK